jgi:ComF family protein
MPVFNAILNLIFPPYCVACGAAGSWFCQACLDAVQPLPLPGCAHCGRPLARIGTCRRCQLEPSDLVSISSCSAHRQPLRKAIHALKYGGMTVLRESLAGILQATWQQQAFSVDVLVPVPLHKSRVRERGYNQSALLARELGKRVAVPVDDTLLERIKNTPAQVGLTRDQRWQNMAGAFRCVAPIAAHDVVLIDDVCTTGATLEACAAELRRGGARSVRALTLARAVGRYQIYQP